MIAEAARSAKAGLAASSWTACGEGTATTTTSALPTIDPSWARSRQAFPARARSVTACPQRASRSVDRCWGRALIPGTPIHRRRSSWIGAVRSRDSDTMPPLQGATAPVRPAVAITEDHSSVSVVKYWAPWSKANRPTRRVAARPPGRRPLSRTQTACPLAASRLAHVKPAMPAPTMATLGHDILWTLRVMFM